MAGPQRAPQEAPQAPAVPPEEIEELRRQLAATQAQLAKVLDIMAPSEG
jgi:DNA-binding transcriptional regulator YiaG